MGWIILTWSAWEHSVSDFGFLDFCIFEYTKWDILGWDPILHMKFIYASYIPCMCGLKVILCNIFGGSTFWLPSHVKRGVEFFTCGFSKVLDLGTFSMFGFEMLKSVLWYYNYCCCYFGALGVEFRALHKLDKHSPIELPPQSNIIILIAAIYWMSAIHRHFTNHFCLVTITKKWCQSLSCYHCSTLLPCTWSVLSTWGEKCYSL